jgi:SAM-dependent methyltransferase
MPQAHVEEILNYVPLSSTIGTAGQPAPDQFAAIRAAGYELVVNLAMPDSTGALADEAELVAAQGMAYVHIPVVWEQPTLADLDRFFDVMVASSHCKVFVHCALNMRVSVFVLLYRCVHLGLRLQTAWADLQKIWTPNEVWQAFLYDALVHYRPQTIVADSYDRILERHSRWAGQVRADERARYTAVLLENLPAGAEVLDLGCGVGLPTTRQLAEHFRVTGVDLSAEQIAAARQNVPQATFLHADMTDLDFPANRFDAVTAFYSLIHLPRQEQPGLLQAIASWLRPGGLLVAALGTRSIEADFNVDWLGAPMYWSSYDSQTNRRLVREAGLSIMEAREECADEFGQPVTFLWVIAEKRV